MQMLSATAPQTVHPLSPILAKPHKPRIFEPHTRKSIVAKTIIAKNGLLYGPSANLTKKS